MKLQVGNLRSPPFMIIIWQRLCFKTCPNKMVVMDIELVCGEFNVTSPEHGLTDEGNQEIVLSAAQGLPRHHQSIHVMEPGVQWCS